MLLWIFLVSVPKHLVPLALERLGCVPGGPAEWGFGQGSGWSGAWQIAKKKERKEKEQFSPMTLTLSQGSACEILILLHRHDGSVGAGTFGNWVVYALSDFQFYTHVGASRPFVMREVFLFSSLFGFKLSPAAPSLSALLLLSVSQGQSQIRIVHSFCSLQLLASTSLMCLWLSIPLAAVLAQAHITS